MAKTTDTLSGEQTMVHIFQVRENEFTFLQSGLDSSQSVVLTQREEHGCQWIALLATFSMVDVVNLSTVVLPTQRDVFPWN